MIDQKDIPPDLEVTDSQGDSTARLAAVHVRYGELRLPPRIAGMLADGPGIRVMVTRQRGVRVRGVEHVVNLDAVREGDKLTGIEWPAGVAAGTVVRLSCERRARVLRVCLPPAGEAVRQLESDESGESTVEAEVVEPTPVVAVLEPEVTAVPDEAPAAVEQTDVFAAVEQTAIEPVSGTLPEMPVVEPTPSTGRRVTAFLALIWFRVVAFFGKVVDALAVRFENVGQDVIDHARVIAKVFFASLSTLVVAGAGIAWWLS